MKKTFTILIAAIAAILMMALPNKAWATDFRPSDFDGQGTASTGSSISATKDGITFACDKGYGTTQIRCYSGGKITISSSNTITSVSFTFSEKKYNGGMGSSTSYSESNLSTTSWTKDLTAQARITNCTVTYEAATTYTVTISDAIANGSVEASPTSAAQNATITLTPTANSGFKLTGWDIKKTSDLSASGITPTGPNAQGKYTFSMPAYNVTVGATFSQTYAVTCAMGLENGSISAEPATAAAGETITVTANPADNYKLKTVTVTETGGSTPVTPTMGVNSATFTMQAYPVTVSATFVRVYHVTYDANTTDYTGTTTDANVYESGASATVQANGFSKDGYTFSTWNTQADGNGTNYAPSSPYTIETADVTLYAQWTIAQEEVTIGSVSGATISAVYSGGSITSGSSYDCGTVIQLRADGLASGKGIVWDVYKTSETSTKVTVTNNSFTLPAYAVTISGTVGDLFVKYTAETVAEGDYIIYDSKAMNQTLNDRRLCVTDISSLLFDNNNTIVSSNASAYTWHIAPNSGYMTISYTANNNTNYVYTTSTTAAKCIGVKTTVDDAARWTFTRSTNTYLITNKTNANTDYANLVRNNNYFACYSKSTNESALYKKSASYQVDVTNITEGDHGTITASTSGQSPIAEGANANIRSGATVTLNITPDAGYIINSLTVYKTGSTPATIVTVTNNQFVMPDYAVTVEVEFKSASTVTLTYSVNGNASSSSVTEGNITLTPPSESSVPTGYTFAGWSTSPSDFSTLYNESYTLIGNTTLYAVFSANKPALFSFEITKADFSTGSYSTDNDRVRTTTANSNEGKTFDVNWRSNQVYQNNSAMQWQASNGYIYNTTDLGTVKSVTVTVKDSQGSFTTNYGTTQEPSSGTAGTGKGYFKTCVGSVYGLTSSVVVTFEKSVPFYFTRVIGTEAASGDITINGPTIIENEKYLDMGSHTITCNDASWLIIEDGGQLILDPANTGVKATFKKNIIASAAKGINDHWYTISSPVTNTDGGVTITSVENLVNNGVSYNLYRLSTSSNNWESYNPTIHDDFTKLETGRGYLYRNNGMEVSFAGEVVVGKVVGKVTTYSLTTSYNEGFNLIGNPYGHSIYKGKGGAIDSENLNEGFYYLTNKGGWQAGTYETKIMPLMGILVKANTAGTIDITDTKANATAERYANDELMFTVSNSQYEDVAYAMFKEGNGLTKIDHRNAEIPMLYISQNKENYSIALMSDETQAFNLNFKAMTTGKYTLSYKAKGNFSYLHVIDLLTGEDVDMLLESEYSFIASPTDSDNRFIVRLGYLPDYSEGNDDIFAYQNGSDIYVSGEGELQIFDITGRFVMSERINGVQSISADALSKGVYVLRIVGSEIKTQKIVVR